MTATRLTITVDFSGDDERGVAGIGIVVQASDVPGRRGPIVRELTESFVGVPFGQGEKFAVYRAMQVAYEMGCTDLKIRSDYNQMRRRLRRLHQEGTRPADDSLDSHILELAKRFGRVRFGYVPRRKNQRAHELSRCARALPATVVSWP